MALGPGPLYNARKFKAIQRIPRLAFYNSLIHCSSFFILTNQPGDLPPNTNTSTSFDSALLTDTCAPLSRRARLCDGEGNPIHLLTLSRSLTLQQSLIFNTLYANLSGMHFAFRS